MAFLTLIDTNNHNLLVNLDLINLVQYDQGTVFIYYSVDAVSPVRITDPLQQTALTNNLLPLPNYFDARKNDNGYLINMGSVKFTDLNQGTLFIYFFGNSGTSNCYKITNPIIINNLLNALNVYIGGNSGATNSLHWRMRRNI